MVRIKSNHQSHDFCVILVEALAVNCVRTSIQVKQTVASVEWKHVSSDLFLPRLATGQLLF